MKKVFPSGTILFRFGPISTNECPDTGKTGIYFSLHIIQSMMMSVEYQKPGTLHIIELDEDVVAEQGKYNFRTDRYFDSNGDMILNMKVLPEENINHYDELWCIDERFPDPCVELFLTSVPKHTILAKKEITPQIVENIIKKENYSYKNEDYENYFYE